MTELWIPTHGTRIEHRGQHGPDCFACKLKTIRFGRSGPASAVSTRDPYDRWTHDPVVQRIQELNGREIDTDAMNKRLRDSGIKPEA